MRPKFQVPQMFDPAAAENWKSHLQREGYVVIKDVLLGGRPNRDKTMPRSTIGDACQHILPTRIFIYIHQVWISTIEHHTWISTYIMICRLGDCCQTSGCNATM